MNSLIAKGEKEEIKRVDSSLEKSKKMFQIVLKANIARYLFNSQAFYKIIKEVDPMIKKAVLLSKENFSKYNVRNE